MRLGSRRAVSGARDMEFGSRRAVSGARDMEFGSRRAPQHPELATWSSGPGPGVLHSIRSSRHGVRVRVQACSTASGARDMEFGSGSRRAPQHPELATWSSGPGPGVLHSIRSSRHGVRVRVQACSTASGARYIEIVQRRSIDLPVTASWQKEKAERRRR